MKEAVKQVQKGSVVYGGYHISKVLKQDFDKVVDRVTEELKKEGFGILTEVDVDKVLKKKIDVDFHRYKILGACNPKFAHRALMAEDRVGVFLPCNVIVQERTPGKVEVSAMDPAMMMKSLDNPDLSEVGDQVRTIMEKVIERL